MLPVGQISSIFISSVESNLTSLLKYAGQLYPHLIQPPTGLNAWIGSLLDGLTLDPILISFLATVVMVSVTQVRLRELAPTQRA